MAEEVVGIKIDVNGQEQILTSMGQVKKALKEAQFEALTFKETLGAASPEAMEAAKRVAHLKDAIGDAKDYIDAFNPDAKFKAFGQSLTGVASGFSAVQGAMAMFGSQSEDVEKMLLKVNSAMALAEGLNGVMASVDSFKTLGAIVKTNVVSAFGSLRGALISTGIGALVIALGLLIANFDDVKKYVLNLFPSLGVLAKVIGKVVDGITDFVGITSDASRELERLRIETEKQNKSLDSQIRILEAMGGQEELIYDKKVERINNEMKLLTDKAKSGEELSQKELDQQFKLNEDLAILNIQRQKKIDKDNEEASKKRKEQKDKEKEEREKEFEKQIKELEDYENRVRLKRSEAKLVSIKDQEKENEKLKQEKEQKDAEELASISVGITKIAEKGMKELLEKRKIDAIQLEDDKRMTEAKKKLAEEEKNARIEASLAVANTLDNLSNLIGKQTGVGKAMAVASATISTIVSAQKAYESAMAIPIVGPFLAPINAGIALAAGYSNIKKILAVQVPNGGATPSPNLPSMSAQSPVNPQLPQSQMTTIDTRSINRMQSATSRAYVIESDITNNQEKITRLNRAAKIG